MPSCWATRRASSTSATEQQPASDVAAPQLHGDADDVVALVEQQGGGHRRVDAARHGDQDLHRPRPRHRPWVSRATAAGTALRARSTSASVVVVPSDRRRRAEGLASRDAHGGQHVGGLDGAARARRARRGADAGLVEEDQQRLGLDAGEAQVAVARGLAAAVAGLDAAGDRRRAARRPGGRAGGRPARPWRPLGRRVAAGRCHADDAGHVVGPAAPLALLPAAVQDRRDAAWRTTRAPTPLGPPNLWALTETRSAPRREGRHVEPRERRHRVGVEPDGGRRSRGHASAGSRRSRCSPASPRRRRRRR